MLIKEIKAHKITDSRGEKTIEVSINGSKASSPSGKSKGKHETPSYHISLDWNIKAINSLKMNFQINSFYALKRVENHIKNKYNLKNAEQFGANALFALESAILKAIAKEKNKELWQIVNQKAKGIPIPIGNAVGGGLHSQNKDHPIFQEFLIIPKEKTISKNLNLMKNIHRKLKIILSANSQNDEGAWNTNLEEEEILQVLSKFKKIKLGIDIAASTFYKNKYYLYKKENLSREENINYINKLIKKYSIFYLEDPLQEEDFSGFSKIKGRLITGDDLTVTNLIRLKKALRNKSINAIIIKPNQNGSLLELKRIFSFCKKNKIKTILSHRSGETLDTALADYSFAFQADYIKTGITTPYRENKLKRLIEIEKSLSINRTI